jgi:tetratricopeptide (TPR) repeat protein
MWVMTKPVPPPDCHHLSAAAGWFELGNTTESEVELTQISAENREHPAVLEMRWLVMARHEAWPECYEIAEKLVGCAPENASGWLHRAYALRRLPQNGGLQKALEALLPAFSKFPNEPVIPYNLSCYTCQLAKLDDARLWFSRALQIGDPEALKRLALEDEDLRPLWDEIRTF